MHDEQQGDAKTDETLTRQARLRAQIRGEAFEGPAKPIRETEAVKGSEESRGGLTYRDRMAKQEEGDPEWEWADEQAEERRLAQQEERRRARREELQRARLAAWRTFMQRQRQTLELRKDGQLATLLSEALPGESPAALKRLADADQRQAEEELVTLMSNGKVSYKHVEELSEGDMPARGAAERLRTTWLKERRDGWLRRGRGYQ